MKLVQNSFLRFLTDSSFKREGKGWSVRADCAGTVVFSGLLCEGPEPARVSLGRG